MQYSAEQQDKEIQTKEQTYVNYVEGTGHQLEDDLQTYRELHQRIQDRMSEELALSQRVQAQVKYIELQATHVDEIEGRLKSTEAPITLDDIQEQLQQNTQELKDFEKDYLPS